MTYLESLATKTMVFGRRDEVLDGLIDEGITGYYFDTKEELAQKIKAYYQLNEEQKQENKAACLKRSLHLPIRHSRIKSQLSMIKRFWIIREHMLFQR